MDEYRIYVASISDYNSGNLYGVWIDCEGKDADELQDEVNAMLRTSRHPNVMVDCPSCQGEGKIDEDGFGWNHCARCSGKGKIPSAEEYAIHDHEGFGDLVGEYTPLSEVAGIVEALEGADDADALKAFADNYGYSITEAAGKFDDAFYGSWDSEASMRRTTSNPPASSTVIPSWSPTLTMNALPAICLWTSRS